MPRATHHRASRRVTPLSSLGVLRCPSGRRVVAPVAGLRLQQVRARFRDRCDSGPAGRSQAEERVMC